MDNENVVQIQNGILFLYKDKWHWNGNKLIKQEKILCGY